MSDYHINVFYSAEDDGYIADIPDLKSCSAFGGTLRNLAWVSYQAVQSAANARVSNKSIAFPLASF